MIKRLFDITFSLIAILFFFPIMILIAIIIKITSKEPVFFIQERVGKHGKLFYMIKFRSMRTNSHIDNYNSHISVQGDPRITQFGVILRKYKLDELPEFFNVFKGDMSIVGPRPDMPGYADCLSGESRNILRLRPGITGPATLKYANEEEILKFQKNPKQYNDEVIYPDKVRINLDYYYNNNLFIDIKIIFATILKVIS